MGGALKVLELEAAARVCRAGECWYWSVGAPGLLSRYPSPQLSQRFRRANPSGGGVLSQARKRTRPSSKPPRLPPVAELVQQAVVLLVTVSSKWRGLVCFSLWGPDSPSGPGLHRARRGLDSHKARRGFEHQLHSIPALPDDAGVVAPHQGFASMVQLFSSLLQSERSPHSLQLD